MTMIAIIMTMRNLKKLLDFLAVQDSSMTTMTKMTTMTTKTTMTTMTTETAI